MKYLIAVFSTLIIIGCYSDINVKNSNTDNENLWPTTISIIITDSQQVFMENEMVEVDSISGILSRIMASYTVEEQKHFTVELKVNRDAKMGLLTEVKEQLRKAKALKLDYETMN